MDSFRIRRSFVQTLSLLGCGLPLLTSCVHDIWRRRARRIGFVIGADYPQLVAAFKEELRRLGYVEGENLIIEMRESQPNRSDLPEICAELAHNDLELIVAAALPIAIEVRNANSVMPMVIATCPGMVSNGFAQSLKHPGGNVTGMDELPPSLTTKRLTLLKTAAPTVSRVALLSTTPGRGGHEIQLADAEQSSAALGIKVVCYRATSLAELQKALTAMVSDGAEALLSFQGGLALTNRLLIVDFAVKHRLPAVYQATLFAEAGGLMAWAPDLSVQFRMAARYVDQILKGANPGDLPIQFPPRYYLTINADAAKGLGLALPPTLLDLADRVVT